MSYILSCCSTVDLSYDHLKARDLHYICFHYSLGDKTYLDDLGQTIPFDEFYQRMANGERTKTSQISAEDYKTYFRSFLEEGKDIIHLTLSSGLSGTINSAMIAKNELEEEFPDRKIAIIDSLAASSGYGLLMDRLADLRDEGKSFEEVVDYATNNRLRLNHWFFSTDLKYYFLGGRISKSAYWAGSLIRVCPVLNVDSEGHLIPLEKALGKKKAAQKLLAHMKECADNGLEYADKVYISHSAFEQDAEELARNIEATFPKLKGKVEIYSIGTTIGAHTGPGTIALFFWGKPRVKENYK